MIQIQQKSTPAISEKLMYTIALNLKSQLTVSKHMNMKLIKQYAFL